MTQISFWVNGEIVRTGLQDLSAELPRIGRRQLRTMMERVYRRVSSYPPERRGQTYQRTGHLFGSWSIEERTGDFPGYTISNDMDYAKWVVGDEFGKHQAWMHKGRWSQLLKVMTEEVDKLPPLVEAEINMVARRNGL
jgi:uncharacterized protein YneF (UPF0154 family)